MSIKKPVKILITSLLGLVSIRASGFFFGDALSLRREQNCKIDLRVIASQIVSTCLKKNLVALNDDFMEASRLFQICFSYCVRVIESSFAQTPETIKLKVEAAYHSENF